MEILQNVPTVHRKMCIRDSSLIAQERWKVMKHCTHIIEAFEQAVYDDKKPHQDIRLDDGLMNVDSLDSTEYSTESVQDEILYIAA